MTQDINVKIPTAAEQPRCGDCKRLWDETKTAHVFPVPKWGGDQINGFVWICESCRDKRLAAHTYYCFRHKKSHTKAEADECVWCDLGDHFSSPVPPDAYVDFGGWRWCAPFICMGCGIEVCIHQWCFSRSCGPCDVSVSKTRRLLYRRCFAGPHERLPKGTKLHPREAIPEDHFVDPAKRQEYPLLYPQLKRDHDSLERMMAERRRNKPTKRALQTR